MLLGLDLTRKNTKAKIIEILSDMWPLNVRGIHRELAKRHGIRVTYQAIHLAMKEFLEEGIVIREGREYMLNPEWIERMASTANSLVEKYIRAHRIIKVKELQELNFGTIKEAWDFLLSEANKGFFGRADECYIQLGRMFAVPLPQGDIEAIEKFANGTKTVLMCRGNGPVDRLAANFLRKHGVEVLLGIPCAYPTNTVLIGNCVVSIYVLYPKEEVAKFNRFYNSIKDILKKDIFTAFSNAFLKNTRVKITINRNPEVYADVLEQTRRLLEETKK
ncbi:hypothetical protein HYY73_01540 [Candidatus Woesearchaeota archaeon]|nr:hypothetical protein [Candidatus Woesearchaeota archaeon]